MRRLHVAALIGLLACRSGDRSARAADSSAPPLACVQPDSLGGGHQLWYSNVKYGVQGHTGDGGTRVAVYPGAAGWGMLLIAVESDFEGGGVGWPPAAPAESLSIAWRAPLAGRGVAIFHHANSVLMSDAMRVDSIVFSLSCAEIAMKAWRLGRADTVRLGRRLEGEQ